MNNNNPDNNAPKGKNNRLQEMRNCDEPQQPPEDFYERRAWPDIRQMAMNRGYLDSDVGKTSESVSRKDIDDPVPYDGDQNSVGHEAVMKGNYSSKGMLSDKGDPGPPGISGMPSDPSMPCTPGSINGPMMSSTPPTPYGQPTTGKTTGKIATHQGSPGFNVPDEMFEHLELKFVPPVLHPMGNYTEQTLVAYVDKQFKENNQVIGKLLFLRGDPFPGQCFHVRGCGRTTLLALSYLKLAKENPGEVYQMQDHSNNEHGDQDLWRKVSQILDAHPRFSRDRRRYKISRHGQIHYTDY